MKFLIEFNSVFEAEKGIKWINKMRMGPSNFLVEPPIKRSQNYGSLIFKIDEGEYHLLEHYKIGFKKI